MSFFNRFASLCLMCLTASLSFSGMISHVTNYDGEFSSYIIIENLSSEPQAYTLMPYAMDGSALTSVESEMTAGTTSMFSVDDLFEEASQVSHFAVTGDVSVAISYKIKEGRGSAAHVSANPTKASRYKFFAGNWSEIFDGIAVVNRGSEAADIWVCQKDSNGKIVQSVKAIAGLVPMAKGLYVIGAPAGSSFIAEAGSYFEVYANQSFSITSLRGTPPGAEVGYLWSNEATVRSMSESTRDELGVWFITDGSFYDVMEMMGYNIANDRLWQLELYRRSARGTLAEIYGSPALEQDILVRTTGYSDEELEAAFMGLNTRSKDAILAYAHGVNRHIAETHSDASIMPFEFMALGMTQIQDWTYKDLMAWGVLLQRNFDAMDYAIGQSENAALVENLIAGYGAAAMQMFNDLTYLNDPDAPTMIPGTPSKTISLPSTSLESFRMSNDFNALASDLRGRQERIDDFLTSINAKVKMGSYAWTVSGDKTHSGNPIIYSGPQMGHSTPSIVCEGSIRGGGLDISGMTVPGIPGIIIGRTPHHAWSMQVGHAHNSDLYLEAPGALGDGPHRIETIRVAGGDDVELPVYRTIHGPVVSQEPLVSWKYAQWGYELNMVEAMYTFATAQSMDDFGNGISMIGVSQHFCYADQDGNIAYWMSGRDPIRPAGEYRLPQGAAALPLEYDIEVVKPQAHDRNTTQGFYGGWNNKAHPDYPNSPFGGFATYGAFHRAHAVQDYLSNNDELTYDEVRDLAVDIAATDSFGGGGNPWKFVSEVFTTIIEANPTEARLAALELLNDWDGHFVAGGPIRWTNGPDRADEWMLMDTFLKNVLDRTFEEVPDIRTLLKFNVLLHSLGTYSLTNSYDWFSNTQDTEAPQTLDAIVVAALDAALETLGDQPWGMNQRRTIDYSHQFIGPIHQTPFGSRSTYAHCVEFDLSGPVRIESMFPLGESGFIGMGTDGTPVFSPLFFSLAPYYDDFTPRSFPLFD